MRTEEVWQVLQEEIDTASHSQKDEWASLMLYYAFSENELVVGYMDRAS